MTLVIKGITVREIPIRPKEVEFDKDGKRTLYTDAKGTKVIKIVTQEKEDGWAYSDGTPYDGKAYKCIAGKPVAEFKKTTVIKDYKVIDVTEAKYFINNDLTYMIVSKDFKELLKGLGEKSLSFKYANRGFKTYTAVCSYEKELDRVFMRCFRGNLKQSNLAEGEEVSEIVSEDNVAMLDIEAL